MNHNPDWKPVAAPGLPTWPRLLFHKQQQRAVVTFRAATWQSDQQAHVAALAMAGLASLGNAFWCWCRLQESIETPAARLLVWFVVSLLYAALTISLAPPLFRPFLARQVFARRSLVWFTPEAIAFRSRMYDNGVVVPRNWQGYPVQIRFDLTPDPEATAALSEPPGKQGHPPGLQSARIVRLVISAFDPRRSIPRSTQGQLARAVPMFPVDLQDAQRLTVVLAAAEELTSPTSFPTAQPVASPNAGLDIDAHAT